MKKQNLFFAIGAAAVAIAVAVPAALSHGPGGGGFDGRGRGPRIERLKDELGLNDQQVAKLKALKDDHMDDAQSLRDQLRAKRDELHALLLAPTLDKAKLAAASREINALEGQLEESRLDFLVSVRGVLTPDQFKTFLELRKSGRHGFGHGPRDGKRFGPGRGFGPGLDDAPDVEQ